MWKRAVLAAAAIAMLAPMSIAEAYVRPASVTTVAGSGMTGQQNGVSSQAQFLFPSGVAVASDGTIYIADTRNQRIQVMSPQGIVSTLAGFSNATDAYGMPVGGDHDGPAYSAQFNNPIGLALANDGTVLYVADSGNGAIRKIDLNSGQVTTLATGMENPSYLAVASNGSIYVSETSRNRVLHVQEDGSWTVAAGVSGTPNIDGGWTGGYKDGPDKTAMFNEPKGLVIAKDGTIYVADSGNQRIRAIHPNGMVTTVAGSGTTLSDDGTFDGGYRDGKATQAQFDFPTGIALDSDGTLFVADTYNHCIRSISTHGQVDTVAGSQMYGRADGLEDAAQFDAPTDIAILPNGALVTVDQWTNTVRNVNWYEPPGWALNDKTWKVLANNQRLDAAAMIHNHLYLPLDEVAKAFGLTVSSESSLTETVTNPLTNQTVTVQCESRAVTGTHPATLPEPPVQLNGTILVPWEFATQVLGLSVKWIPEYKMYLLRSPSE